LYSHRWVPSATAAASLVNGVLTVNTRGPSPCSLYSATPNRAFGCAAVTSLMML
jgi:hypothetical protein